MSDNKKQIKLVIFDYDGVFTNGDCIFYNGSIVKKYNVKDKTGLKLLSDYNIKHGLISSYKSKYKINYISEITNESYEDINYLNFDLVSIGEKDKLKVLNKWINELNITYNNVAYIGDDINDLSILKQVYFSACPNDAIEKVKHNVKYICKSNGGEGCVREFIDIILNHDLELYNNKITNNIRNQLNYQLDNFNLSDIKFLSDKIKETKGNIYFSGIGKSETLSYHCCDLLKSISIKAFRLDAIKSLHGDIGTITEQDMIIIFSKSGNTIELINLVLLLKKLNSTIVLITLENNNKLQNLCNYNIILPFNHELSNDNNSILKYIPSNSCMSYLLFSNILVNLLESHIDINKYKLNHMSGSIGSNLYKLSDCIIYDYPKFVISSNTKISLHNIFLEMTNKKIGCSMFVNSNNNLVGILTDGDIRRLLLNNENIKEIVIENLNKSYYYESDSDKYIIECKKHNYIPIIKSNKLIGLVVRPDK